jgi:D-alanine-D-alanine ligase
LETLNNLKINKCIEIVVVPIIANHENDQKNIGIRLDEKRLLNILSDFFAQVSITLIESRYDLNELIYRKPDLVFSGVKYFCFEKESNSNDQTIWLSDVLDTQGIAYIGSNREVLNNEYDKSRAKEIMLAASIKTAPFFTTSPEEHSHVDLLPIEFPLFIKPIIGGDSRGINADSIVHDFEGFKKKVLEIHQNQGPRSLVEPYLIGNEYSVGILEDCSTGQLQSMPVEIIPSKNELGDYILDFNVKKNDTEKVVIITSQKIKDQVSELACNAFRALGGKLFGRIDIKMDRKGTPHFLEANLLPGLGEGYFYRACFLNLNMSYEEMIVAIAKNALVEK